MGEMVDRVALAIKLDDGSPCISHDKGRNSLCRDPDGCICRSLAKEAINRMREPTPEMVQAMQGHAVCSGYVEEGWAAAIDKALE